MRKAEKVNLLFDFAASQPDGFTYVDIKDEFGWSREAFFTVVRELRLMFGEDSINLTCQPQGSKQPWLYKLVGNYDDARSWSTNRIGDLETRLETIQSVAETLTHATDGRTIEGRKARRVHRTIGYLLGELAEIAAGGDGDNPIAA